MKIKVGIVGGAGYTGGELIRILLNHPHAMISFIQSRSNAGKDIASVHQDLAGDTDLKFTGTVTDDADVVFLCMPFPTLKLGPGDSARSHTTDEFIFTSEIEKGIETYIQLLNKVVQ